MMANGGLPREQNNRGDVGGGTLRRRLIRPSGTIELSAAQAPNASNRAAVVDSKPVVRAGVRSRTFALMTIRLRAATLDDAAEMGVFHVRAWQQAYRGQMPDEFLAQLDPVERAGIWRRVLGDPTIDADVILALDGPAIVGLLSSGAWNEADAEPGVGELAVMYAAEAYWGRGVGPALHDRAIGSFTARGFTEAVLWVLDSNARAIRFYEREGWKPDGESRPDTFGGITVNDVRYRRRLD